MTPRTPLTEVEVVFQTFHGDGVCVRETEDSPDIWPPRAACTVQASNTLLPDAEPRRGHPCTVAAPARLLIEKGLL
ncbi:hypothetical protein [Jannaschia formosa]|uniref:hypothetical protein n=1 Tax=Jannaschia formosa TaxID=2259592 RepID=UPI000E1C32AE|nr:hypothetical protein [Jannaschia formosa]TFL16405.1 hypothetical protein DR046_19985 [Jannaschia formosa]